MLHKTPIVYLNGEWLPQTQAKISVLDRGFLFGDGVYEVIPVYQGIPFLLNEHLQRLTQSLQAIHLPVAIDPEQWQRILQQLIDVNREILGDNQSIYLQITRGAAAERYHGFATKLQPTIYIHTAPLKTLSYTALQHGKSAITLPDVRWHYSYIKSTSLLANVLLYQAALDAGADEAILLRDNEVVEGATSNVFMVRAGTLYTPPLAPHLLAGITRSILLELAHLHHIPVQETLITEEQLRQADEIWITSSTREIYPIVNLDGNAVGAGKAGVMWHKMREYYQHFIRDYAQQNAINKMDIL